MLAFSDIRDQCVQQFEDRFNKGVLGDRSTDQMAGLTAAFSIARQARSLHSLKQKYYAYTFAMSSPTVAQAMGSNMSPAANAKCGEMLLTIYSHIKSVSKPGKSAIVREYATTIGTQVALDNMRRSAKSGGPD